MKHAGIGLVHLTVSVTGMADLSSLSVKQMKEELVALGSSAEGCCERSEIEAKLLEVRAAKSGTYTTPAAPPPGLAPGMEQFMASMTASFNTMGDSFGSMVCPDTMILFRPALCCCHLVASASFHYSVGFPCQSRFALLSVKHF